MGTIKIQDFTSKFSDEFLFDTNVWLLIYGPIADYQKKDQREYSRFLATLIQRNSSIYITSMIISEFANVILRIDFRQWCDNQINISNLDFKRDFVGTSEYVDSVRDIKQLIIEILSLPIIVKIPDNFNSLNMDAILERFDVVDFNDAYISTLSQNNNYKIVTNDRDFQKLQSSIEIITTQV